MNYKIRFLPSGTEIEAEKGETLGEAALSTFVPLALPCGGRGLCRNCQVQVLEGKTEITEYDKDAFSSEELKQGYRLACKLKVMNNLVVKYPFGELKGKNSFGSEQVEQPFFEIIKTDVPKADISTHETDSERLKISTEKKQTLSIGALRSLGETIRNRSDSPLYGILSPDRIISFSHDCNFYGLALDIGTTTVAGAIVNIVTESTEAAMTSWNCQAALGADVISRIQYCNKNTTGTIELNKAVLSTIKTIIRALCKTTKISRNQIVAATVVGNPTMIHLFAGIPPSGLARAPFVGVTPGNLLFYASELGLDIFPSAEVFILPGLASNVGSDIVSDLLVSGFEDREHCAVLVDLGTNAEIVAGNKESLCTCSTAAGPAFEGASITHGMRARPGAIDRVSFSESGGLRTHVIGDQKACGICGSGLMDLLAMLLDAGIVDETGRMLGPEELPPETSYVLKKHLVTKDKKNSFILEGVEFTSADVRQLQLAKGSVAAGIRTLLNELNVKESEVEEVLLAGAFGNFMSPQSALRIGLIPEGIKKITPLGNAAGCGARLSLLCKAARTKAIALSGFVRYIKLADNPAWRDYFTEAMYFS